MFNLKLKAEKEALEKEVRILKAKLADESVLDGLKQQIRTLKDDLADLKQTKKMEEEDIKHMVKIHKERNAIELEKKTAELERAKHNEVAKVKDDYRDKMEVRLQTEVATIKEMYGEVLKRLPNVTARLKGNL